jgi:tRNA threonylcarbamoyladenosine biosynthesis protein TsaB
MRTLVIDTATRACSIALFDNGELIDSAYELIGRGHAERLVPMIAALPEKGRSDQIMVNAGPGSFTGIRVGVSAAKALAFAWQVPVHGYGCLALVAAMAAAEAGYGDTVDVVMSGGHGEYFFQRFDADGTASHLPATLSPAAAAENSSATIIAGDVAAAFAAYRPDAIIFEILPNARYWQLISSVQHLPARPVYGRAPDAKPAAVAAPE